MKVILYPNFSKRNALATALKCCDILDKLGIEVYAPDSCRGEISSKDFVKFGSKRKIISGCDAMLAIGGDGTILKASEYASEYDVPLLGINTGRLGFMASMESDELENLSKLKTGDFTTENRMMIDAALIRGGKEISRHSALNDIVVARPYSRITDLEVSTGGRTVSSIRADGMVIATPTGSTAYALSAGGPILEPETECIQVTPICPHSLFSRTMVFTASRVLEVRHFSADEPLYFSVDGRSNCDMYIDDKLIIEKSPKTLRLIDIKGYSFFEAVNNKLMSPIK